MRPSLASPLGFGIGSRQLQTRAMSSAPLLLDPSSLAKLATTSSSELKVLDASWHMPNLTPKRDPYAEFKTRRLKLPVGSQPEFWDVDRIASKGEMGVGHMLPSRSVFETACSRLGISPETHVVVYDTTGVFSAPRTAFTFKSFGHAKVSVLDGGLPRWQAERHDIDTSELPAGSRTLALYERSTGLLEPNEGREYTAAKEGSEQVVQYDEIKSLTSGESSQPRSIVMDARPNGRFTGKDPEPRPGLSSGHMPRSISVPFSRLLAPRSSTDPPYQTLLARDDLRRVFASALEGGEDSLRDLEQGALVPVASCGSGMTAAVIHLALQVACGVDARIYDESWTGMAQRPDAVILKD